MSNMKELQDLYRKSKGQSGGSTQQQTGEEVPISYDMYNLYNLYHSKKDGAKSGNVARPVTTLEQQAAARWGVARPIQPLASETQRAADSYVAKMDRDARQASAAYEQSRDELTRSWWDVIGNAAQSAWNAINGIQPSPEQGIRSAEAGQRLSAAVQAKDERGRLYKEMETAKSAAQEARDYQQYVRLTEKYGSTDALAQDYADRIKAIEDEYREKPDQWRQARRQVNALEKEKQQHLDFLQSYETNLKNNQENAAVLDAWAKGHGGTYESYQLAQQNYDELDRRVTQLQNELMASGGAEQDYSGWATDEMSAAAIANRPTAKGNSKELQTQLEQAIREREQAKMILQYAQAHQADELNKAPDFELKAASGEEKFKAFKQEQAPLRESWEANAGYATDEMSAAAIGDYVPYDPRLYSDYREPDERWTEDEKKRFYYLFDDEKTRQQAYDYAIGIDQKYNRSDAEARDWSTREFATRNFGTGAMASAVSVPANLIGGGVDYLRMALENSARGGIYETQYDGLSRWADTTRGAISEKLNESGTISKDVPVLGGKGLGDLYQLMMSMADSSVAVMAGGGAANAVFFGSAAASTTRDALERGIPGNRAVALGFAAGAAEVAGETLSVEHLLKQGDIADYLRHGLLREMAKQGGVEASEEVLTSILNMMADAVINGDQAELQQKVYVNVANGMAYDEAVRQASKEWLEELGTDALGGFLSGGLMSGGRLALQSGVAAVTKYTGDAKGDLELARLTTEGSRSRSLADQYQQRLDKKGSITNLQAARLQAQTSADISAADRPALLRAAEARLRDQSTSKLTSGEYKRMAQDVVDGVLGGRTSKFSTALEQNVYEEMRMQIAGETVRTGNWLDDAGLKLTEARNAATKRMKMVETKDGEKVEVKNATMKDGELQLTIEQDGETKTVDQKDLKLDQYQMRALKTLTDTLGDDAAAAYNLMSGTGLQYGRASSIASYATAFGIIRDTFGRSADTEKAEAAALASSLRKGLTDEQVRYAVAIGQKRAKENGTLITREKSVWGTGKVTMDGGTLNDGTVLQGVKNKAQVLRSRQYAAVKAVAKALGIDVVLFESRADKDGNLTGAQGAYQDGVIYLDWNAGMNDIKATSERMLLRTMSHELTHFLQQNAPEDYEKLKNYVTAYLAEKMGENYRKLVMEKMANQPGLSYDGAIDEVVADSCETMLRDSQYVQEMIRKDRSFGQKIWDWIKKFFGRIEASDIGAKYMQATIDELREIWDSAMKNAVESRPDVETSTAEIKAEVLQSNAEALTEIDPTEEAATATMPDGQQYSIRSMKHDIAEGKMFEDLARYTDMSREETQELRKNLERLTDIIALNRDILDLNESFGKDNRPFKPYKPNSDPLYTLSLDFSTLCRKRLMTQYVIERLQTELTDSQTGKRGRPLTAEEQLAVRDLMKEYGQQEKALKVACAMCYVEAARLKAPGQIQRFMRDPTEPMRRYFALKNKDFNASVREAQADFKEQHGYARDAKKADMKPADRNALNKLSDRLRSEYRFTAEEQAELDLAKTLPNETYLTAANLARLAEEHPVIYDAYTATIRSATRSKSLEADIPYYYGDSSRVVSDDFIAAVNRENGMRFSSWSDFQIQHMLDMMTAVIELSTRHCAMHGYTKFLEQVRIFGRTGMMFNMSGVANGTGLKADGSLDFSPTESVLVFGQDGEYDAIQAREDFPETAGLQCIGISTEHIQALLDSDIIDYIIPYHTSGLNATLRRMAQISNWKDFTAFQNAKQDPSIRFDPSIHDRETWHKEPVFSEFFIAAKQESNGYRAGEKGIITMRRAADLYKQMCRDRGMMPKFSWGNSKVDADFSNDPNYWKLLIDRKMINQKTGALIEQKPVRPDFDFKLIEQMVQEAVDAYDPTLQDRALNYVREHLDELPQRIADLKKAGAVKKVTSKTNKAAKTLQAGPVAAVSEGNAIPQLSTRSTQTAEEVEAEAEEMSDARTQFSVRQGPPPKKTMIGYKVFMADKKHPGQMYPTKVKNPGGQGTPIGVWLDADTGEIARNPDGSIKTNTRGRISVKANGGTLAWRPGWHLGSLPEANQMNRVDPKNPESDNSNRGTTGLMWDNYIFCECEFAADEDYQLEAFEFGTDEKGLYNHSQAGLPYIPKDGYYKYRTNPDPSTAPWFISGSIRITKILDDDMRREIIEQWNAEHPDQQMRFTERYSGKPINLADYGLKAGPVAATEDLSSVAPGVDYSDEIRNLPGYTRHALNFDDPNVQEAFRIQQIEDRKDYYIDKYNREHRDELENASKKAATTGGRVQFAVRQGMTEQERYDELKNRNISVQIDRKSSKYQSDIDSLAVAPRARALAKQIIVPLAEELGVLNKAMTTPEVDVQFIFSGGGLKESRQKQLEYGGNYVDFAKALINIDDILGSAILIEQHSDYYVETARANEHLINNSVLLGAFYDGENIVPVLFEVKKYDNTPDGRLYLTVTLTKIKADVRTGENQTESDEPSLLSAFDYSIADIFKEIKPEDDSFLKYIPGQFLNDGQRTAKAKAVAAHEKRLADLRAEYKAQQGQKTSKKAAKNAYQLSTRGDLGYHAGDLGKAEHLNIQGRDRGTGHFGTGTYFVGEEEKVTKDSYYGKRPQHAVDFSDYNLFRPRNDQAGYQLHDALRIIDGGIKREWIRPALDDQFNIINPTGYYDLAKSKYGEDWAHGDNLLNARLEYAADNGIKLKTLDEYKADVGEDIDDSDLMFYYEDYVKETIKEEIDSINAEYREFEKAVFDLNLLTGLKDSKIYSALMAVADYQDATPRNARADSYATVFMKAMGYDGVDVRGTRLDNTQYGSVIYDVKPATVAYSIRGGTKTDTQLLRDLYDRIEAKVEARAKRNEAGLEKGYQKMVRDKQGVIYELQEEQRKALEKFHELSERYYEKEREVNAALQELDRLVQHSGSREQIQAQRAKVSAKEEQMAKALERLTQAKGGSEIQEILRQEREIQAQRTQDRIRDSIDRRDLRKRIDKLWKELNARVTNPSEKKRIPVELMQQTLDVLEALNMDTSREGSKAGEKLRAKLDSLQARYRELQNDPDFRRAAVYDAQVAEYLTNMIAQVGDTPINKMSVAQMETVLETLKAMVYTANRALKLKLGEQELEAYEVSKAMTRETRSVEKPKTGFLSTWINAQLSPERMFNRLGGYSKDSYWGKVYGMLNEGQLKQTRLQMEGSLIFEDLMEKENEKNFQKLLDPKNTVDIGLKDENGEPVLITHGMMISLYMHLQNDQNIRHIAYGGLTIPALQDYYNGKKVRGNERATRVGGALQEIAEVNDRLHETEDADEIAELEQQRDEAALRAMDFVEGLREEIDKQLTDYDRQWIAASKELFDGFSKRELNQTTLEVYGIKRANVENYYPIWVDGDFLNTPFETVAKDMSLENAGFMKERIDSSKPIRLADVTDVTSSQIRKVAQYCGLMPAIRGFNKVWGKTQTGYRDSLQKAVHETFGQAGVKYVENLMADLNGARGGQDSALGEFLNRMRGHMAQASLTMSLRVAMGQTASYPTAAAVVGWGPLMKALAHGGRNNTIISRADQELIRKWSPLLYYRMKGYSTTELGDIAGMNDKFSRLWKKAWWLTGWIQATDGATVGRLWYAAEYYVQDHNKDLVKGTDAYYEAVAKVFNDIVEKTQPDYTTMQRPDILRSPNALVKQLTMFLTQRLQNFNILYDAAATYSKYKADAKAGRNGVTTEDVRQAGIATRRAVISQLAAAATITAFKFLADAILHSMNNYRDDDDEELKAESISREILDMFMDSLAGNVLGGGEIYDLIESKVFGKTYYGIEVGGLATVMDMVDAFSSTFDHVLKAAKDDEYEYGREQILKDVDKLARNISTVAGIPYANGKKIAFGLFYHAQDIRNGAFLSYEAGVERSNAQQASRLYRAYTNGDGAKVKQILEEVPEDKQKDVYSAVRKLIREQQKSGELNVYEAMRQMKNYGGATDQVMAEYIKDLYEAGALPKADAEKYLQEYAGRTKEAATKTVTNVDGKQASGVNYNDIDDMFKIGTMNAEEARKALVGYGIDKDTANMKVEYWSYQQKNPGTAMTTENRFEVYWKNYKPIGMTPSMYDDFYVAWNAVQGTDKNHDGKTDANSKKPERIAIIDSLPLSREQKDALFSMEWKTGLQDAPWNK